MTRLTPDDFRPDGLRAHCPFCDKTFDMDFGDRLENALMGHSHQCHPETTEKVPEYIRQLYDHVVNDNNKPKPKSIHECLYCGIDREKCGCDEL